VGQSEQNLSAGRCSATTKKAKPFWLSSVSGHADQTTSFKPSEIGPHQHGPRGILKTRGKAQLVNTDVSEKPPDRRDLIFGPLVLFVTIVAEGDSDALDLRWHCATEGRKHLLARSRNLSNKFDRSVCFGRPVERLHGAKPQERDRAEPHCLRVDCQEGGSVPLLARGSAALTGDSLGDAGQQIAFFGQAVEGVLTLAAGHDDSAVPQ